MAKHNLVIHKVAVRIGTAGTAHFMPPDARVVHVEMDNDWPDHIGVWYEAAVVDTDYLEADEEKAAWTLAVLRTGEAYARGSQHLGTTVFAGATYHVIKLAPTPVTR